MFSLIALYFEYRNARAEQAQTLPATATQTVRAANDAGSKRAVASAA